jgi:hypothetical protein
MEYPAAVSYNLSLDQTVVTDDAVNLDYTLSFSSGTGPFSGNGGSQAYTVNGNMVAGQAGACPLGVCDNTAATNRQRTLTVTY